MPTVEKLNEYTVILDNGQNCTIKATGFVVQNGELLFPLDFAERTGTLIVPVMPWMAAFPIEKVSGLMAAYGRDSTYESGWCEIGGGRTAMNGRPTKPAPEINWPEHARYRAQDADGQVRFFESEPTIKGLMWDAPGGSIFRDDSAAPNWKDTLITRPT